jgi:hypothetical protein
VALETWIDGKKYFDRAADLASRPALEKERAELVAKAKTMLVSERAAGRPRPTPAPGPEGAAAAPVPAPREPERVPGVAPRPSILPPTPTPTPHPGRLR